jgi:HSP20 family protein
MPKEVCKMTTKERTRKRERALQATPEKSFVTPWDEMEHWFDEFGRRGWLYPFARVWPEVFPFEGKTPRVDILDREKEVVVRAELPGVEKDDLDVSVRGHSVTIRAHAKHEEEKEEEKYYRREMRYGEYQRTLELPETVDETQAKATFKNGILELVFPRTEKTRQRSVKVE